MKAGVATLCALAAVVAGATLSAQKAYSPKTPWGDPDLQGQWPATANIPMQRPASFGTRATLTDEELALLDAIRETGSLSRAAARLNKAPSTISHAARQLEARFDALLFDRRRYRLQLTPAGQTTHVAVTYSRTALEEAANDRVRAMADEDRGAGREWDLQINTYLRRGR